MASIFATHSTGRCGSPIPAEAGVGLKPQHYNEILATNPGLGWFEVHPENYMGAGGPPHRYLSKIRERYPLSLHSVGTSLGSAGPLDSAHLNRLKQLVDRYEPGLVSEHISWSSVHGAFLNDLLPLPYTREALQHLCDHVDEVQETLGRRILVENPSSYLLVKDAEMEEPDFLIEVVKRTGCGLLLDVNNVYVSAHNHGYDAAAYIDRIPAGVIGEIHLAGHTERDMDGTAILIDDHGAEVIDQVWSLYVRLIDQVGEKPTLIEWDTRIPEWNVLYREACRAQAHLDALKMAGGKLEGTSHATLG